MKEMEGPAASGGRVWNGPARRVRIQAMRGWLCFAVLVLAARPVAAQSLLPARFGGWQAAPASAAPVPEPSPADAALFRACHQQAVEQQTYSRDGLTITVILRRLGDPSYAYSAFSVLRPAPVTDFRPTPHSAIGAGQAMMLVGNLLVSISGQNLAANAQDFSALAALLGLQASTAPYPTLWQYLPTEHLIPHSDRYALDDQTFQRALGEDGTGDWAAAGRIGFQQDDAEAEVARYNIHRQPATLILLSYPTPELAAGHLKDLAKRFAVNPETKAAGGKPVLYAKRIGSMLGLVSGAPGEAAAQSLLGQIRYQTIVTWNEPGFKLHELTMADYVVGTIFGTFAILGIALVVGIALGMIRVGIKHFLPGLIFDRHRAIEVLQLGLSSKPVDGRDFY